MARTRKIRLGLIGAGSVVREIYQHLYFHSQYSDLVQICGVADPNAQYRDWFGNVAGLPANRRFSSHKDLLSSVELDAVQVNTPDHLHCAPAIDALSAGLDVIVPKPTAATVKDAHAMIQTAHKHGRFLGVDFHKREDPRIKEAEARFRSGRYGKFQAAVFYMLDRLMVVDPAHSPPFFASPDFAEKNTPVSFLTVHMADALMKITGLTPYHVRAIGYAHKLPALRPVPVNGYDLVDTEIIFKGGGVAHILTGWALPNSAWSMTVQSARLICSDGMIDLGFDTPGLMEVHADGLTQVNPLFRNTELDKTVTGYGMSNPGRLYQQLAAWRGGELSEEARARLMNPMAAGFYTTAILEAAEKSLAQGTKLDSGATLGTPIDLAALLTEQLGADTASKYGF